MPVTRRTLLGQASLAGLSLALSACKAKDSEPAVRSGPSTRKKVRLTYGGISVPKERGVLEKTLKEQGIDVEWLGPFPNHAPTLQAVATNTADFSFGGSSTPAAQAILSGSRLTFVSWSVQTPRTTSIIVLPQSNIRKVEDLVGKTVAVNRAGVAEFLAVAALEKYKVPRDQVKLVYLNPPDAAPAFASGKVDAWAIWQGHLELSEVQYGAIRIFEEGKELDEQIDFGTYLVRDEYARNEPDTIRKVIHAFQQEIAWANDHTAEAQALMNKLARYPQDVLDKLYAARPKVKLSFLDDEGIANLQRGIDWLTERKILSGKLNVAEHSVRL